MQSPAGLGAALAKIVSRTRPEGGASGPRCLRGRVVEAEDGLNSAPLRPSGALQDPKGRRCLKYRPTSGCLQPIRFVFCGPDGEHHNPQPSRASSSSVVRAAGGRGPAVDRWLTRSSDLLTLPAAVASGGATAIGHCRGGAASALASSEACPRGASNGRAAWAFGDQKMLALELARYARPQSLNSAWHWRRALPERVPAAVFLQGI